MNINVPSKYSYQFCHWLIKLVYKTFMYSFDDKKTQLIENYINTRCTSPYVKHISVYQIFLFAIKNLQIYNFGNYYTIKININARYGLTNFKIVNLCNLVQYGVIGIQGYPLLVEIFELISSDIDKYYQKYLQET